MPDSDSHRDGLSMRDRSPRPYQYQDGALPTEERTAVEAEGHVASHGGSTPARRRTSTVKESGTDDHGSESGTEADDESPRSLKALPPARLQIRKGLIRSDGTSSPLLTPSQLDQQGQRLSQSYFEGDAGGHSAKSRDEDRLEAERHAFWMRKLAERVRRLCEAALLGVIGLSLVYGNRVWQLQWQWYVFEVFSQVLAIATLIAFYPLRLVSVEHEKGHLHIWSRFHIPPSFDPATVLYPTFVPVAVSMALVRPMPQLFLPNLVLGLASLPPRLFPGWALRSDINTLHWMVAIAPIVAARAAAFIARRLPAYCSQLLGPNIQDELPTNILLALFPLHQTLLPVIHFLTTSSLLPAEKQMLATILINLLLFARAPQAVILQTLIWVGGTLMLLSCTSILRWNVALARIPTWRLRDLRRPEERGSLWAQVTREVLAIVGGILHKSSYQAHEDSDADEDDPIFATAKTISNQKKEADPNAITPSLTLEISSDWRPTRRDSVSSELKRRNTVANGTAPSQEPSNRDTLHARRQRTRSGRRDWTHGLTPFKATLRKRFYATYIYLAIVGIILLPVRIEIGWNALNNTEPILWAIDYLFSGLIPAYNYITTRNVAAIMLDTRSALALTKSIPHLRDLLLPSNSRLAIMVWDLLVLIVGLSTVLILSPVIEVDTRRKVFHAIMVAMLLPTIYVDPCFCALALALVLAIFLILEIIRAGQVPPLGTAIGRFVAPYVDGRDLRGPMVVSHVFLLVGCAIPFWLSMAGFDRTGPDDAESGWRIPLERREVAMLSGVVCVGMGDAAASLIGRRFGRRKWPWIGGKSLEGSAAFAAAVVVGLSFAKLWLRAGGWVDVNALPGLSAVQETAVFLVKAALAGSAASFLEAVLTGANDNVMVPVALWLICRGLRV